MKGNSSNTALRLACSDDVDAHAREHSAAERIFAHWVFMLGKNPRRTALGPARRRVIDRALAIYDEETLLLAIDGCAASAWHSGHNDREREFNDIELILRDEAHVERFATDGERLRERALRAAAERATPASVQPIKAEATPEEVAAQRQALRELAARVAGRRVPHG